MNVPAAGEDENRGDKQRDLNAAAHRNSDRQIQLVLARHGDRGSTFRRSANDGEKNNSDEDVGHSEGLAGAFRRADEDLAHPRGQDRGRNEAANGAADTPLRSFVSMLDFADGDAL